jgi:hypothetical protein
MRKAQNTLQALNVEIRDESVERDSPIVASARLVPGYAGREQGAA